VFASESVAVVIKKPDVLTSPQADKEARLALAQTLHAEALADMARKRALKDKYRSDLDGQRQAKVWDSIRSSLSLSLALRMRL
jgi:hypothetical protein